jgi:ABC-type molybdate transport system substrate-binding protein
MPIEVETVYPIGVLQTSANKELAEAFVQFATSHEGLRILTTYGFEAP